MSEDLQNVDHLFRGTIDSHEEIPSKGVWDRLQSQLDKEDAAIYKRKFIMARRAALALLLLLLSVVMYETSVSWYGSKKVDHNNIGNDEVKSRNKTFEKS